eukprot:2483280-Lingulodinium_polyedra.AAC.1
MLAAPSCFDQRSRHAVAAQHVSQGLQHWAAPTKGQELFWRPTNGNAMELVQRASSGCASRELCEHLTRAKGVKNSVLAPKPDNTCSTKPSWQETKSELAGGGIPTMPPSHRSEQLMTVSHVAFAAISPMSRVSKIMCWLQCLAMSAASNLLDKRLTRSLVAQKRQSHQCSRANER